MPSSRDFMNLFYTFQSNPLPCIQCIFLSVCDVNMSLKCTCCKRVLSNIPITHHVLPSLPSWRTLESISINLPLPPPTCLPFFIFSIQHISRQLFPIASSGAMHFRMYYFPHLHTLHFSFSCLCFIMFPRMGVTS